VGIHNRINLYLLDAIVPLRSVVCRRRRVRTVGEQFAHIHNVRLMWLKSASPDLLTGLMKIEKELPPDKKLLHTSLTNSGEAIKSLLDQAVQEWRQSEGLQATRVCFPGLSDFTRVASPWSNHPVTKAGRERFGQKDSLRTLGMGRENEGLWRGEMSCSAA